MHAGSVEVGSRSAPRDFLSPRRRYSERMEFREVVYFPPLPRAQDHLGNGRGHDSEKQRVYC